MWILAFAFVAFVGAPLLSGFLTFDGKWFVFLWAFFGIAVFGTIGKTVRHRRSKMWRRIQRKGGVYVESRFTRVAYDTFLDIHGTWKLVAILFLLGGIAGSVARVFLR